MTDTVRILYVDHGGLAQAMVRTLENERFEPVRAEDGIDALKRLDYESFDVVVVPDSLPDVDVQWFAGRASNTTPDVSIVVFGEAGDLPPDVVQVPRDEFGRRFLDRLETIIAERTLEGALERQDRLEAVSFDIAHGVVTADDPESMFDVVYTKLASSKLFDIVWLGRYDADAGEFEGEYPFHGRFSPGDISATLGVADPEFIEDAIESAQTTVATGGDSTRSTASVKPSAGQGSGRESFGRSYAAVPIVSDDRVAGLCLLGANRPGAFDGTELSVLANLGEVIGESLSIPETATSLRQGNPARIQQFVKILAHELRNPLQVAESYLEFGREDDDPEALAKVSEAHSEMESILEAVLTIVGTDEDGEITEIDLSGVAMEVWQTVSEPQAELTIGESVVVTADRGLLKRLLTNVLRNAVVHGGPDVRVRIGALPDARGFFIEDDGPGIPPQERDSVFEWGYSTGDTGMGVGLSFLREIVEAHGWDISIADGELGGARFEIITGATDAVPDGGRTATDDSVAIPMDDETEPSQFCFVSQ